MKRKQESSPRVSEAGSPSSIAIMFNHHCSGASSAGLVLGRKEILFSPVQEGLQLSMIIFTSSVREITKTRDVSHCLVHLSGSGTKQRHVLFFHTTLQCQHEQADLFAG